MPLSSAHTVASATQNTNLDHSMSSWRVARHLLESKLLLFFKNTERVEHCENFFQVG